MKLIENESGPERLAGERSGGTSSPVWRDEGRTTTLVAPRTLAERLRAVRSSVWAPVLVKSAGVVLGMLALAAVGASSLARGSGVPLPAASARPVAASPALTESLGAQSFASQIRAAAGLETSPSDAGAEPPADAPGGAITADGKIILNLAGASDLRHLPGIGAKRAEAILELRAKLGGRFKRVTDLLRVKGIGQKGLKKIEPHVVLDAPKPA